MENDNPDKSIMLRRVAALLEAVASLLETTAGPAHADAGSPPEGAPALTASALCEPTRKMPAMEQQALALDDAVRGVARAIGNLEPQDSMMRERLAGADAIPLPDATTRKLTRPEQMIELMQKLVDPPELEPTDLEPTHDAPGAGDRPDTLRMGSRGEPGNIAPPGVRSPQSFGRSHPK